MNKDIDYYIVDEQEESFYNPTDEVGFMKNVYEQLNQDNYQND